VIGRSWLLQNPLFGGYGGVVGYLPGKKITIAVAATYAEGAFDDRGNYKNGDVSQMIFADIGALLAPDDAPPRPGARQA
jgi:hypothetical protein